MNKQFIKRRSILVNTTTRNKAMWGGGEIQQEIL